jgi:uncharacterized membrane protein YphA (DoxX/SURF4 family)
MLTAKRFLEVAADDHEPETDSLLWAFAVILLIHVSARAWVEVDGLEIRHWLGRVLLPVCLLAVVTRRGERPALVIAAGVLVFSIGQTFPLSANHLFLEALSLLAVASFDLRKSEQRTVLLQTLRWGTAIVLFHTGLQKILYGSYFDGRFLGYEIARTHRFSQLFGLLIPPDEFSRLRGLSVDSVGVGPFSVDSLPFLLMSNSVYLFELSAPFFLLWRRTRRWAAVAAIVFLCSIQMGARELMFGFLFLNLLFLYLPPRVNRRAIVPLAVVYLVLVALSYSVPLEFEFN